MADNITTFMWRLSWNQGVSTSWNPQGLSRSVMGLLYLYLYIFTTKSCLAESRIGHFGLTTVSDTHFVSIFRVLTSQSPGGSELPEEAVRCLDVLHVKHRLGVPLRCITMYCVYVRTSIHAFVQWPNDGPTLRVETRCQRTNSRKRVSFVCGCTHRCTFDRVVFNFVPMKASPKKNPQHAFLRRGSKAVGLMS